jgi:uncharacterized RmlC-like cupin family protein
MKKSILIAATFAVVFFIVGGASAQTWNALDSKSVKTLADNKLVLASEVTLMPGGKEVTHTHSAHFFYALTECHLIVHYTDGTEQKYDLAVGDNGYSDPERPHWTENVGTKTAKFLIVELKEHPYKATASK